MRIVRKQGIFFIVFWVAPQLTPETGRATRSYWNSSIVQQLLDIAIQDCTCTIFFEKAAQTGVVKFLTLTDLKKIS